MAQQQRPAMHTYYENPSESNDDDMKDLLQTWKDLWQAAGWDPIVLTRETAIQHPSSEQYEAQIQSLHMDTIGEASMRRYLAMAAVGGGWMCELDVFPIRDFRTLQLHDSIAPDNGYLQFYSPVSNLLAYGHSSTSWEQALRAILIEAKAALSNQNGIVESAASNENNFWTDSLSNFALTSKGILNNQRRVMPAELLLAEPPPWPQEYCRKRQFRKPYIAVHMDSLSLLIHGHGIRPKDAANAARTVIPYYEQYCGVKVVDDANNRITSSPPKRNPRRKPSEI